MISTESAPATDNVRRALNQKLSIKMKQKLSIPSLSLFEWTGKNAARGQPRPQGMETFFKCYSDLRDFEAPLAKLNNFETI